jgi:hypothetical protein
MTKLKLLGNIPEINVVSNLSGFVFLDGPDILLFFTHPGNISSFPIH